MRRFWFVTTMAVLLLVQVSFLPAMRPFGVVPDLILVVVVLLGLDSTVSRALTVGVVGGLLLDLSSGADFGLRTGLFLIMALTAGLVQRSGLNVSGPIVALILVALGTVLQTVAIIVSVASSVASWQYGYVVSHLAIELMINLSLVVVLHPLIRWLVAEPSEIMSVA